MLTILCLGSLWLRGLPYLNCCLTLSIAESKKALAAAPAHHAAAPQAAAAPAQPVKKEKRKKDPNAPKKPMSAFFCFQMARRQGLKDEAPGLNHKDIIKVSQRRRPHGCHYDRVVWCVELALVG